MGKALTKYVLRRQERAQYEEKIRRVFGKTNKPLEVAKREHSRRKKSWDQLAKLICEKGVMHRNLREPYAYRARTCNLNRQVIGYIDHLYVRYPVPRFLYQAFFENAEEPFDCMREIYRKWFVSVAQGMSFARQVKGVMTSKEAKTFLDAPWDNFVHENVWWAKLTVAGVPSAIRDKIIAKILANYFFDDPSDRFAELISFFANNHEMIDVKQLARMLDYLAWRLMNDGSFRLKGRTASSVTKLSDQWHRMIRKARLGTMVQWEGLKIAPMEFETMSHFGQISELYDNQQLMIEGLKQKNCVYTYVDECKRGVSRIFSMRVYARIFVGYDRLNTPRWEKTREISRVTIEVDPNRQQIYQVRGPLNRAATSDESRWIRLWAHQNKMTFGKWCWGGW